MKGKGPDRIAAKRRGDLPLDPGGAFQLDRVRWNDLDPPSDVDDDAIEEEQLGAAPAAEVEAEVEAEARRKRARTGSPVPCPHGTDWCDPSRRRAARCESCAGATTDEESPASPPTVPPAAADRVAPAALSAEAQSSTGLPGARRLSAEAHSAQLCEICGEPGTALWQGTKLPGVAKPGFWLGAGWVCSRQCEETMNVLSRNPVQYPLPDDGEGRQGENSSRDSSSSVDSRRVRIGQWQVQGKWHCNGPESSSGPE